MTLSHSQKEAEIGLIKERFDRATSAVLVDFRGVNVGLVTELRARFRAAQVEYKVVKNNLVKKALAGTALGQAAELAAHLKGMTGIAWSFEDPSAAAKIIKAFRGEGAEQEKLVVKAGVYEGTVFAAARVESDLALMPGKDEVRAMLLAQLLAPAQSLVRQLTAPGQNLAYVLDAYRRSKESG